MGGCLGGSCSSVSSVQWGVNVSLFTIISVYARTSKIPQPRAPCNQNNMATTVNIFLSP